MRNSQQTDFDLMSKTFAIWKVKVGDEMKMENAEDYALTHRMDDMKTAL